MSSKTRFSRSGQFVGGGADKKIVLGYKPRYVKVVNVTDRISAEKFESMEDDKALNVAADGTATFVDRITLNSDGFTVLTALAVSAKVLHYFADEGGGEN